MWHASVRYTSEECQITSNDSACLFSKFRNNIWCWIIGSYLALFWCVSDWCMPHRKICPMFEIGIDAYCLPYLLIDARLFSKHIETSTHLSIIVHDSKLKRRNVVLHCIGWSWFQLISSLYQFGQIVVWELLLLPALFDIHPGVYVLLLPPGGRPLAK